MLGKSVFDTVFFQYYKSDIVESKKNIFMTPQNIFYKEKLSYLLR